MAWSQQVYGATWKTYVDNGTTASGAVKTLAVSMGTVLAEDWDATKAAKAGAIVSALIPIMDKTPVRSLHDVSYTLVSDE